jgi:hypothetical protein
VQTLKSCFIPWQVLKKLDGEPEGVPVNGHGVAWGDVVERSGGVLKEASPYTLSQTWYRLKKRSSEAKGLAEKIARRVQENPATLSARLLEVRACAYCCCDEFSCVVMLCPGRLVRCRH